jgi:hypothetical protein
LPSSIITTGGTLTYELSTTPDPSWGAAPIDRPPSFAAGRAPAVGYSVPSGGMSLKVGQPTTIELGIKDISPGSPAVHWSAASVNGLTLSASSGAFAAAARSGGCSSPKAQTQTLTVDAASPGSFRIAITMQTTTGTMLPPVVLDLTASR